MKNFRIAPGLILGAIAALVLAVWVVPSWAHHSFGATFDANRVVTITGVVTRMQYSNPHSHLFLNVKQGDQMVPWTFEGYPPVVLYRTGWSPKTTVKVGETVTVFGWGARDGSNFALGREVTFADGKKLFMGPGAGTGEGPPLAPGATASGN